MEGDPGQSAPLQSNGVRLTKTSTDGLIGAAYDDARGRHA